jgi:1,4-dihydroxy-6-naphthoate synthase
MAERQPLAIAYTPDSDDAFYYFALETGRVPLASFQPTFHCQPISALNGAAQQGTYHVTAISSVAYPAVAGRYAILSVGTSVGRGYGPVLVSRDRLAPADLRGKRVGVPGIPTTGWFLLRWLCPEAVPVAMPFDHIAAAVAAGEIAAGVMIHEELLYYPQLGLHRVVDLGASWCQHSGLPLAVGLNVIRRDLGGEAMQQVCSAIRASLRYSQQHRQDALAWVSCLGRGVEGQCTTRFVEMFANQDSVHMPADVRLALRVLFVQCVDLGICAAMPPLDIVEGTEGDAAVRGIDAA